MLRKEECVLGMVQKKKDAAVKDAQTILGKEECASGMEQMSSTNDATEKDAQIILSKEECVGGMVQRPNCAAEMDAQTKL